MEEEFSSPNLKTSGFGRGRGRGIGSTLLLDKLQLQPRGRGRVPLLQHDQTKTNDNKDTWPAVVSSRTLVGHERVVSDKDINPLFLDWGEAGEAKSCSSNSAIESSCSPSPSHPNVFFFDWSSKSFSLDGHPSCELLFKNRCSTPISQRSTGSRTSSLSISRLSPQGYARVKPISKLLPKYFEPSKPSSRLKTLQSSAVKILKVLDNSGSCMVAFQDEDSLIRFKCLLKHMSCFYTTPEGYALKKSGRFLEHGEIVAATVYTSDDISTFRRVKIHTIQRQENESFKAYAVDIDNLTHWSIRSAFSLITPFYEFPTQACQIKVSNFNDIYPKGIFEVLFEDKEKYLSVMKILTGKIFVSLIGRSVSISNISIQVDNEEQPFVTCDIDPSINMALEMLYLECFREHFIPRVPEEGTVNEGVITDILPNGIVGICMKTSLLRPIDTILNGNGIHQLASQVCEETTFDLLEKIKTMNCRLFVAADDYKSRYARVKVIGHDEYKLKVQYMDSGREASLNIKQLVCALTHNPKIHPILAVIPAQALRCKLFGIQSLNEQQCIDIYEKYKHRVLFKVIENRPLYDSIPQIEIFDESFTSTFHTSM